MAIRIERKGEKVSEEEISALEVGIDRSLPAEYRRFMPENNGGLPETNGFAIEAIDNWSGVTGFLSVEKCVEQRVSVGNRIPDPPQVMSERGAHAGLYNHASEIVTAQWRAWHRGEVQWALPIVEEPEQGYRNLKNEKIRATNQAVNPLADGSGNVYTKGPMVVHMLRYLFRVHKKNDDAFWKMLRTFLDENKYQKVGTSDFVAHAERHLGISLGWFFDQWFYGGDVPVVNWDWKNEQRTDGKWVLTVDASQEDTEYQLLIPVFIHFGGNKVVSRPLALRGKSGRLQLALPAKPARVTLNDSWEALVKPVKRS